MGYMSPVIIHLDILAELKKDEGMLCNDIADAVNSSSSNNKSMDASPSGYCNYINVFPPRHTSDHSLYLMSGGSVTELRPHGPDWDNMVKNQPELLGNMLEDAERMIKMCKKSLKK
tara:strand:- start:917 stop:1264 length:348 start_codon:yes stop_codon:yes gene_type:complete